MPHLNALFQTALRLKSNRREAELAIEGVYADAWDAYQIGAKWGDWRLELFKILCRHTDESEITAANTTDPTQKLLNQVPTSLRKPILLIDCHGFTYIEAAEILGVSVEVLSDRLRQGRDQVAAQTLHETQTH